jgi:cbb3-type cytochrome oxidase maturation protein
MEGCALESIYYLLVAGASMGLIALFAFLWGVNQGAFENAEDAKYIVFRDEDDD